MMSWISLLAGDRRDSATLLNEIFGGDGQAERWAQATMKEHGIDSAARPIHAMKILRDNEPRLSLGSTKFLVDLLNR